MTDPAFTRSYADNAAITMAARLRAEIMVRGATRLDVATGYLATSAWSVVGDALARLERFRLLLGKDYELVRTRSDEEADVAALVSQALRADSAGLELPTRADAAEVEAFLAFLSRPSVQARAWRGHGFLHAKAYILDASAGVGSANFTAGGLVHNKELVSWRQDDTAVAELRGWFNAYWDDPACVDYKADLIATLQATRFGGKAYSPYELLIRTLAERYGLDRPPSLEGASFHLKWFQADAVFRLIKLLNAPAGGALLADAVGLGKTFMALGVIHHVLHSKRTSVKGRPVTLIVPASVAGMWEAELRRYSLDWAVEIVRIQGLRAGADLARYASCELVVIDEAHRLRGGGVWFQSVLDLLVRADASTKVLLLTATPVNTSMQDLTTLLRVITRNRRNVWAPEIPDFESYLKRVEKGNLDPFPVLDRCVVRRSRSDLLAAQAERIAAGQATEELKLPTRRLAHEDYRYAAAGADEVFDTFAAEIPALRLAPYDLERFRRPGPPAGVGPDDVGFRQPAPVSSLAGLVLSGLLKRFESSLRAIRISLARLDRVLERFSQALALDPPRVLALEAHPELRRLIQAEAEIDPDDTEDSERRWQEAFDGLPFLDEADSYDLVAVSDAVASDRDAVAHLLAVLPPEADDGKIAALIDLITRPMAGARIGLGGRRLLVFTQYRDTATYIGERLSAAKVPGVEVIHGGLSPNARAHITASFDPGEVPTLGESVARVLVSTDVLAEGHNLQRAEAVVNFDLHWNPQVAVQRSGRVDRMNSPHNVIYLVSFLPEEGLERHLGLVHRLNQRFGLYKLLGLADEAVTKLAAEGAVGVSFEQLRRLYHDEASVLDDIERAFTLGSTDYMRQPLEVFLAANAEEAIRAIPVGVQSVKMAPRDWTHGPGAFIALSYGEGDAKETFWRFYPWTEAGWGPAMIDEVEVFRGIVCSSGERRAVLETRDTPSGPGGIIDWDLLYRAADEVAQVLTQRRATATIIRGASERSARLRTDLLALAGDDDVGPLNDLLDRLEQIRVEDYDARPAYRAFRDRLAEARRSEDAVQRHKLVVDVVKRGIDLFGPPAEDAEPDLSEIRPHQLSLVAWEMLVGSPPRPPLDQPAPTLPGLA